MTTSESYSAGSVHTAPLSPALIFHTECQWEPFPQFLTIFQFGTECLALASPPGSWGASLTRSASSVDRLEDRSMWWWERKLALRALPIFQPQFHSVKLASACPPSASSPCAPLCRALLSCRCIYVRFNKVTCIQKCVFLNARSDVVTVSIALFMQSPSSSNFKICFTSIKAVDVENTKTWWFMMAKT